MIRSRISSILVICAFGAAPISCEPSPFGPLQKITVGGVTLKVEVADTPDKRTLGLMYRDKLAKDQGMVFIYQAPTTNGFWMKNTKIPLSIAFIDENFKIIDIQDMRPLDPTPHKPSRPYRYALEVNRGWFREQGIRVGSTVRLNLR